MAATLDVSRADLHTQHRIEAIATQALQHQVEPGRPTPLSPQDVQALMSALSPNDFDEFVTTPRPQGGRMSSGDFARFRAATIKRFKKYLRSARTLPPISPAVQAAIDAVTQRFKDAMRAANIRDPFLHGSTARGTALSGNKKIDIDFVNRGNATTRKVIDAAKAAGFKVDNIHNLPSVAGAPNRYVSFHHPKYPDHPVEMSFFNSESARAAHFDRVSHIANVYRDHPECAEASRLLKTWNESLSGFRNFRLPSVGLEALATDQRYYAQSPVTIARNVLNAMANDRVLQDLPSSFRPRSSFNLTAMAAQDGLASDAFN